MNLPQLSRKIFGKYFMRFFKGVFRAFFQSVCSPKLGVINTKVLAPPKARSNRSTFCACNKGQNWVFYENFVTKSLTKAGRSGIRLKCF